MKKSFFPVLLCVISSLLTLYAIFHPGWFFTHDFVHAARIAEMARGLVDGQFPVIWSKNFGYGYGMPLYLFYAPLPFFLGSILFLSGLDVILIVKILYIIVTVVSWWGVYLFSKELWNKHAAYLSAFLYLLAPYRALNLYVRGALSESFGMAFSPFVLYGLLLIWKNNKSGYLITSLAIFFIALSHNLSLMLTLPAAGLFLLFLMVWDFLSQPKIQDKKAIIKKTLAGVLSLTLGVLTASFYLIPAFYYQNLTKIKQIMFSGYSDYHYHFLYIRQFFQNFWGYGGSNWGPVDEMSFFQGYAYILAVIAVFVLVGLVIVRKLRLSKSQFRGFGVMAFFLILYFIYLFFSLERSVIVWDNLKFLSILQFPWRFLGPAALFISLTAGGFVYLLKKEIRYLFLAILILLAVYNSGYFRPQTYLEKPSDLYYTEPAKIVTHMSSILPDYIPQNIPDKISPATSPIVSNIASDNQIQNLIWNSKKLSFDIVLPNQEDLTVAVADFPGWQVSVDGQKIQHTQKNGLINFGLNAGTHAVLLQYRLTSLQLTTLGVSIVALVAFILTYKYLYTKKLLI